MPRPSQAHRPMDTGHTAATRLHGPVKETKAQRLGGDLLDQAEMGGSAA